MPRDILGTLAFGAISATMIATGIAIDDGGFDIDIFSPVDPPERVLRTFHGTVTEAPYYPFSADSGIRVEVDGAEHYLADIAPRVYQHCGRSYDSKPEVTLRRARALLPVGTEVTGYIANDFDDWMLTRETFDEIRRGEEVETFDSYLHVGDAPSVNVRLIETGWTRPSPIGLDLKDKTVGREHAAVVAANTPDDSTAAVFCAHAEDEMHEDEERDLRRTRRQAAVLHARWDRWDRRHSSDDYSSGGGGGYTGPRCYQSDGAYVPC